MEIEHSRVNGYPFLELSGRVDVDTSSKLRKALHRWVKKKATAILIGLDGVGYMDTSGVATLIECQRQMEEYGGRLLLVAVDHQITEALSLAGVKDEFEVFEDRQHAADQLPSE